MIARVQTEIIIKSSIIFEAIKNHRSRKTIYVSEKKTWRLQKWLSLAAAQEMCNVEIRLRTFEFIFSCELYNENLYLNKPFVASFIRHGFVHLIKCFPKYLSNSLKDYKCDSK